LPVASLELVAARWKALGPAISTRLGTQHSEPVASPSTSRATSHQHQPVIDGEFYTIADSDDGRVSRRFAEASAVLSSNQPFEELGEELMAWPRCRSTGFRARHEA